MARMAYGKLNGVLLVGIAMVYSRAYIMVWYLVSVESLVVLYENIFLFLFIKFSSIYFFYVTSIGNTMVTSTEQGITLYLFSVVSSILRPVKY